jgi:hypothetical protein
MSDVGIVRLRARESEETLDPNVRVGISCRVIVGQPSKVIGGIKIPGKGESLLIRHAGSCATGAAAIPSENPRLQGQEYCNERDQCHKVHTAETSLGIGCESI